MGHVAGDGWGGHRVARRSLSACIDCVLAQTRQGLGIPTGQRCIWACVDQVWRGYVGHTHTHALVRAHAHVHAHACTWGRPGWRHPTVPRRRCGTRARSSGSSRTRTAGRTPADMCACVCVHMCTRTSTAAHKPLCARAHMNTCANVAHAGG